VILPALLALLLVPAGPAPAGEPKGSRADFSGTWTLQAETGDAPAPEPPKGDAGFPGGEAGGRGRGRSSAGGSVSGITGLPLEAIGDVGQITVTDDGSAVTVERPNGRQRVLFTDGEERELDDGDGPAKVVVKRKGARGETITVSASWSGGSKLTEVWEVTESPRRLTVTGKVTGLQTFRFRRVYAPAPPAPPPAATPAGVGAAAPTPEAVPASAPAAAPAASPVPSAAPAGAKPECSIRPPRGTAPAELRRMAKITLADASARATAAVAPKRVSGVISSDPEVNDGCLVWPFDLRLDGEKGVLEVLIDAGDGKVLSARHPDD
jgi:hypothetical protein